jgi:hypothetical protein
MRKIKHAPAVLGSTDFDGVCADYQRAGVARPW